MFHVNQNCVFVVHMDLVYMCVIQILLFSYNHEIGNESRENPSRYSGYYFKWMQMSTILCDIIKKFNEIDDITFEHLLGMYFKMSIVLKYPRHWIFHSQVVPA